MKTFKLILVVIVLLLLGIAGYFLFGNYGNGFRSGMVVKLSTKGVIFKTMEGQLVNKEVFINSDNKAGARGMATQIWEFTVDDRDEQMVETLNRAMIKNKNVILYYREKYFQFPWVGDTKYIVYKVEVDN